MSLLQNLLDLFELIFKHSSPEVQRKQLLKRMENEIRSFTPEICKEGMLLGNFGEALFGLYKNVRPLENLFAKTICPLDIPRQHRFEAELIVSVFSVDTQALIEKLSYEERKIEVLEEKNNADRIYSRQRKKLETIIKEINSESFKSIDYEIMNLRNFEEFCRYSFVTFLQTFDSSFLPGDMNYKPQYRSVPISKTIDLLEDFYFLITKFKITTNTRDAVFSLAQLVNGQEISDSQKKEYLGNLQKINYIMNKILQPQKIKTLIQYCKHDEHYEPRVSKNSDSPCKEFADLLVSKFEAEERRMKTEIQDQTISSELSKLFQNNQLEEVVGYNQKYNELLRQETNLSFKWILPTKILKNFLHIFVPDQVCALLNDIVIEGFFNNQNYKSNFSTVVFSVMNFANEFQEFEESFGGGQKNSVAIIESYIRDSKRDKDFIKKLEQMVTNINNEAYKFVQNQVTVLKQLHKEVGDILTDSRKPSGEIISNLKVLMMSSRNRDKTAMLETLYPNWNLFFEIMKNYVIIAGSEMAHD